MCLMLFTEMFWDLIMLKSSQGGTSSTFGRRMSNGPDEYRHNARCLGAANELIARRVVISHACAQLIGDMLIRKVACGTPRRLLLHTVALVPWGSLPQWIRSCTVEELHC